MHRIRAMWFVILVFLGVEVVGARGQESSPKPGVTLTAEPLVIKPGDPLSLRTLVQRPPAITGALSWTIETRGHRGPVVTGALSPDGKRLATSGADAVIRIWNLESGELLRILVGHSYGVPSLSWSPDGKMLASAGGGDGQARIWDSQTGMTLRTLKGHKGSVTHVAWSPDGKSLVVAGGTSGFVTLWDLPRTEQVRTIEVGNPISAIAWNPSSTYVAIAGRASGVQVRELRQNTNPLTDLLVPDQHGVAVAWSPDGKYLVGGSPMKTIVWEAETGKPVQELDGICTGLAFSPDSASLAVTGSGDVRVWKTADWAAKPRPALIPGFRQVEWMPDSSALVVTQSFSALRLDAQTLKELGRFDLAPDLHVVVHPGRPILTIHTRTPALWDGTPGKAAVPLEGHTAAVTMALWSKDGKYLATAGLDRSIRIWDATGQPVKTLHGHEGPISTLAWGDGATLASASLDRTIRVWDAASGTQKKLIDRRADTTAKRADAMVALAWSRDGKVLAIGTAERKLMLWPLEAEKPQNTLAITAPPRAVAWSANGKTLIVSLTSGEIVALNPAGGKPQTFGRENGNPASMLIWNNDSTSFLAARSHVVQIWRLGSVMPLNSIPCLANVLHTAWGPANSIFASCTDRCGRVYDAGSEALRVTAVADENQRFTLVSANGHYRATDDNTHELIYVVQTPTSQEMLSPKDFATRYRFKNVPAQAILPTGK